MRRLKLSAMLAAALIFAAAGDELLERARSGDPESQIVLAGELMLGRNGRRPSPPLAVYWYRQAAIAGHPFAQYNLALCYQRGWGTSPRPAAAFRYFERAMKGGVVKAAVRYAVMLHDGVAAESGPEGDFPEVEADPERALAILRRHVDDGEAEVALAQFLSHNADKHVKELRALLERHAAQPKADPDMLIMYAAFLRSGAGGENDAQLAVRLLERAAAAGSAEAMAQLAEVLHQGFGTRKDHARADELREAALKLGSPRAMTDRGVEYLTGVRRPHDPVRAFELFRRAAEKQYPPAMRHLARCFAVGIGTEPDQSQAFQYYFSAAQKGDAPAQFQLAECFRHGRSVEANLPAAFYWYKRSATGGNSDGMRETGAALLAGRGVPPDREQAIQWLRRAAAAGDRTAAEALGINDARPF